MRYRLMMTSTRRLRFLFSSELLGATGLASPQPLASILVGSMPISLTASLTKWHAGKKALHSALDCPNCLYSH